MHLTVRRRRHLRVRGIEGNWGRLRWLLIGPLATGPCAVAIAGHGNKLSGSSVLQNDQINTNIYIIHEYTCIYIFIVVQKKLGIPRNTKASL